MWLTSAKLRPAQSNGAARGQEPWDELAGVPWFADLEPAQLRLASRFAEWVPVTAGARLQRQGFHVRWLWVPVDGPLELRRNDVPVGRVGPGGAWGEAEALLGVPSAVDVHAVRAGTAVSVPANLFHGLLGDNAFAVMVARRQARASLAPRPLPRLELVS